MDRFSSRTLATAALIVLTGCGTAGPTSQSPALPSENATSPGLSGLSFVKPAYSANQSLVFVGNVPGNEVYVYRAADLPSNPSPIATIATEQNCPYGLAADTVVVADAGGSSSQNGSVVAFKPNMYAPYATLTTDVSEPSSILITKP